LFPTVLSAIQARAHSDEALADCIIIQFGVPGALDAVFQQICREKGIQLIQAGAEHLHGFSAMYARLFLNELLPMQYRDILYLDGDIQIGRSLNALIAWDLPPGKAFAAVADPLAIELQLGNGRAAEISRYFENLAVTSSPASPYFNSGALKINREGWIDISRDALTFLREKPECCLWQDQSALNFAGHAKFEPMSFRWNFPIFFRNCGVESEIGPGIYHFMSKPKPWHGNFKPWNARFCAPYATLIREYPALAGVVTELPRLKRLKYFLLQNFKWVQETLVWRLSARRTAILEFNRAGIM
jgi:lipopolysaccharide biosynthesis glycosyltransferase